MNLLHSTSQFCHGNPTYWAPQSSGKLISLYWPMNFSACMSITIQFVTPAPLCVIFMVFTVFNDIYGFYIIILKYWIISTYANYFDNCETRSIMCTLQGLHTVSLLKLQGVYFKMESTYTIWGYKYRKESIHKFYILYD